MPAEWSFYCDFFPIEGFGVVILGAGKSKAGRVAAGMDRLDLASTDMLELRRDGARLLCRNVGPERVGDFSRWREWARVDYFALCLREQGTGLNYRDRELEVVEVDQETFVHGARWYLAFPTKVDDASERLDYFRSLVDGADLAGFVVVPWMSSHDEKGQLVRSFFSRRRRGGGAQSL